MIAFALPWMLGIAGAGVLAISALHLLSVRRPPELLLPTARFLPERDVRAVSRTRRPSDVLLLAVRIGILLTAGVAAALPAWQSRARERAIVVVADGGVGRDTGAMHALVAPTGSASRVVFVSEEDVAKAGRGGDAAALIPVAWRAASQLAQHDAAIDSVDLHLLLSTAPDRDAGLAAWRSTWPGRVTAHYPETQSTARRVVVVDGSAGTGARQASGQQGVDGSVAATDDPVRAAFGWHAARNSRAAAERVDTVVLVRGESDATAGDAHALSGAVVYWPMSGVPANWRATLARGAGAVDSAAALAVAGRALIGPFPVTALWPHDTAGATMDTSVIPIAWWSDGRVAATERRSTGKCERSVAIVSNPASDVLLSVSASALFDRLLAPCENRSLIDASVLRLSDVTGGALASADDFRGANDAHAGRASWVVPMLFALSLLLLVVEWRLRTRALAGVA